MNFPSFEDNNLFQLCFTSYGTPLLTSTNYVHTKYIYVTENSNILFQPAIPERWVRAPCRPFKLPTYWLLPCYKPGGLAKLGSVRMGIACFSHSLEEPCAALAVSWRLIPSKPTQKTQVSFPINLVMDTFLVKLQYRFTVSGKPCHRNPLGFSQNPL